jgi:hypothetical protein
MTVTSQGGAFDFRLGTTGQNRQQSVRGLSQHPNFSIFTSID